MDIVGVVVSGPDGVGGSSGEGLVSGDNDTGGVPVVPLSSGTLPPPGGTEPPQVCSDELLSITLQAQALVHEGVVTHIGQASIFLCI